MSLNDILRKLESLKDADMLVDGLGTQVAEAIHSRTLKGRDMHEVSFRPYSPKYAKKRIKAGRNTGSVNLTDKGYMFINMTNKREGSKAIIYFSKESENAKAAGHHLGNGRAPKREFFGIGRKLQTSIMRKVENYYRKKING